MGRLQGLQQVALHLRDLRLFDKQENSGRLFVWNRSFHSGGSFHRVNDHIVQDGQQEEVQVSGTIQAYSANVFVQPFVAGAAHQSPVRNRERVQTGHQTDSYLGYPGNRSPDLHHQTDDVLQRAERPQAKSGS